jgi:phosphoserine phosphatase RsbU/P
MIAERLGTLRLAGDVPDLRVPSDFSYRVLVVDDDPFLRQYLELILAQFGHQVATASSGKQALAHVEQSRPDLIFLDVMMPEMDGLQVLRQLRSRGHDNCVIMMTAFGSEDVAMNAVRQGADDYVRKPLEDRELEAALARAQARLELSRQNAALRCQLDDKRRQLEAELARAAIVQNDLIPQVPPEIADYEIAAKFFPARQVGGDFYDWQEPAPGMLTFAIGDVMGKGMPAAIMMATVRSALRATIRASQPAKAFKYIASALHDDLSRAESYVTMFLAQLNVRENSLAFVDAGHGHAFLRRRSGAVEELLPRGLPLGILPSLGYVQGELQFDPGDTLALYSDGLVEALAIAGKGHEQIAEILGNLSNVNKMMSHLLPMSRMQEPLADDLSVVLVRRKVKQSV